MMIQNIARMSIQYLVNFIICNTRLCTVNKKSVSRDIREPCIPSMLIKYFPIIQTLPYTVKKIMKQDDTVLFALILTHVLTLVYLFSNVEISTVR